LRERKTGFLVAAKRGDPAAFEILCKQSANTVFHIARRMMRTKEDAEDVMQESFSTGLHSSQELQRRFSIFNVAVPHCH